MENYTKLTSLKGFDFINEYNKEQLEKDFIIYEEIKALEPTASFYVEKEDKYSKITIFNDFLVIRKMFESYTIFIDNRHNNLDYYIKKDVMEKTLELKPNNFKKLSRKNLDNWHSYLIKVEKELMDKEIEIKNKKELSLEILERLKKVLKLKYMSDNKLEYELENDNLFVNFEIHSSGGFRIKTKLKKECIYKEEDVDSFLELISKQY